MVNYVDRPWGELRNLNLVTKGQLLDELMEPTGPILKEHGINSIDHLAHYESSPLRSFPLYDFNTKSPISWSKDLFNADNICAAVWRMNYFAKHEYKESEKEEDYRIKRATLHLLHMEGRVKLLGWRKKNGINKLYEYHSNHYNYTFRLHIPSNANETEKLELSEVRDGRRFNPGNPKSVYQYSKEEAYSLLRNFELNYPS